MSLLAKLEEYIMQLEVIVQQLRQENQALRDKISQSNVEETP